MAKFTATIELHNAEKKDYETLNAELVKESFKDVHPLDDIVSSGVFRKEYSRSGKISLPDVAASVTKAASKTGRKYSFTVVRDKHNYN